MSCASSLDGGFPQVERKSSREKRHSPSKRKQNPRGEREKMLEKSGKTLEREESC